MLVEGNNWMQAYEHNTLADGQCRVQYNKLREAVRAMEAD